MPAPTHPEKRRRITLPPAAVATIPDDLLISEIFLRLPVESLMRVKFVCRAWRAAVEDPDFVRCHLALSRARPPSLLITPLADDPDDEASEDVSFHRLALDEGRTADVVPMFEKAFPDQGTMTNAILPTHCDGLIALATATGRVFVCNPATREFVTLPPGSRDVRDIRAAPAAALCYDSWRDRYVVARYFYRKYDERRNSWWLTRYDIGHEIFTLGDDGTGSSAWAATADPPHAIGPASPVCTRDAVYWCTSERYETHALLRFGLHDRAFDVVPCPPGTSFHCGGYSVTELAGKLCYVDTSMNTPTYDVWVADDGSRPQWSLRCRVDFHLFGRPGVGEEALLPVVAAGGEMIIAADYKQLYIYDVRRKSVKQVVDLEEELAWERPDGTPCFLLYHVVPYVESLVSISALIGRS